MVHNCLSEESFSTLKCIKGVLRPTVNDQKLNNLTVMNTEADILQKVDFQDVVKEFSSSKCHKSVF